MSRLARRLDKLEAGSKWGSKVDLIATGVIFMRTPEGGETDPRVLAAKREAEARGQTFRYTTLAAGDLPLWRPVPLELVSEEILDEAIAAIRATLIARGEAAAAPDLKHRE